MDLEEDKIEWIQRDLRKQGLTKRKFRQEILDHICCAVEHSMEEGLAFEEAYQHTLGDFGQQGLRRVQEETYSVLRAYHRRQQRIVCWISSAVASLLLFMVVIVDVQARDLPDIKPLPTVYIQQSLGTPSEKKNGKSFSYPLGINFIVRNRTPVLATAKGLVKAYQKNSPIYGTYVILDHGLGFETLYANLSEVKVKLGQSIHKEQVIALVQGLGNTPTAYLHYEIIYRGKRVNPLDYFTE